MLKPETRFIEAVERRLIRCTPKPFCKKFAERFDNGWPDCMYIGASPIPLWVEYKVHPNKPTRLQLNILETLMRHGQNVAIITLHNDHTTITSAGFTKKEDPVLWIATTIGINYMPPPKS